MENEFWSWTGDIHLLVGRHWAGVLVTVASVLCGGLIGWERERAHKPAGVRTLILICLGSAIFTQASLLIAGESGADRGRIAAQIVSGIGFLGAGAIIRERGLVIGVTTGAGIWATAAVGLVLGTGYLAAGVFFSLLIVGTLAAARAIERVVSGPCRFATLHVAFDAADGRARFQIESLLDEHLHDEPAVFSEPVDGRQEATIRYCTTHRDHRAFLGPLASLEAIRRVSSR